MRTAVAKADTLEAILHLESQGAYAYWAAWHDLPITFPKTDLPRVPDHWRTFGTRRSPISGSPRLAANPANAILNYLYAVVESETRLAVAALGLDPGLGFFRADTAARDSLACDVMEPIRPQVDAFVLDWITRQPLKREWFFERRDGNCRLMGPFAARLSETTPTWGRAVAPWAEWVARTLWSGGSNARGPATRLTQAHRRLAKGQSLFQVISPPKPDNVCRVCGANVTRDRRYCSVCAQTVTGENFSAGREIAQRPEFLAKRSATQRQHKLAISNWKPSELPAWLTPDVYTKTIQPALASVPKSRISLTLGVSEPYASDIRAGRRRPHPRHWQALAQLVELPADA